MIVSGDDARLLFNRWRDDSTRVRIRLLSQALIFDGVGVVTEAAADTLAFEGSAWRLDLPLAGAEFSFSDPREIPNASVRESESRQYEFGIAIDLATGDRLTILELKEEAEAEEEEERED
jgi:hypothetical protein